MFRLQRAQADICNHATLEIKLELSALACDPTNFANAVRLQGRFITCSTPTSEYLGLPGIAFGFFQQLLSKLTSASASKLGLNLRDHAGRVPLTVRYLAV